MGVGTIFIIILILSFVVIVLTMRPSKSEEALQQRLNLEPDTEGGRGLALVEALSSRWGWHPVSTTGLTKVTWAEWRPPSGAGRRSAGGLGGRARRFRRDRAAAATSH